MKQTIITLITLLLATAAWAHEGHEAVKTDFASDTCAQCQMAVTNKSYAAQIGTATKPLFFDDIGCLIQYERQGKIPAKDVHARFVRTVAGDAWVNVVKAVWVLDKDVRTPMGYGLHAFPDKATAEAFLAAHGGSQVVTWDQAKAAVPDKMGAM